MKSTFFSGGASSLWATLAMATAPAVWELEGPTILGPSTSKTLINDMGSLLHGGRRFL